MVIGHVQAQVQTQAERDPVTIHNGINPKTITGAMSNKRTSIQTNDDEHKHIQPVNQALHELIGPDDLFDKNSAIWSKSKIMEELTGKKGNSGGKRRMDVNVKLSKVSLEDLIRRNNEKNSIKKEKKKIGSDIRKWMTSERFQRKILGCVKFYPIFRKKNNVES